MENSPAPVSMHLDDQLCFALYSASLRIQALYRPRLKALGLTYSQYLVLLVLWAHPPAPGLTVSALGRPLFLDSATLTPLLKRMEKAGWVKRRRAREDERRVLVSLTDKAIDAQEAVRAVTAEVTCAAGLATPDPHGLLALLTGFRDGLEP